MEYAREFAACELLKRSKKVLAIDTMMYDSACDFAFIIDKYKVVEENRWHVFVLEDRVNKSGHSLNCQCCVALIGQIKLYFFLVHHVKQFCRPLSIRSLPAASYLVQERRQS